MIKSLIWKDWICPFGSNLTDFEYPGWDMPADDISKREYGELPHHRARSDKLPIRCIMTPMGIVPMATNLTNNKFNFWIGNTNFPINHEVKNLIKNTPGVEALEVYTKYRFRIGIGECFDDKDVRLHIQKRLGIDSHNKKMKDLNIEAVDATKKMLAEQYQTWAILVLPNGKIETACGSSEDDPEFISKFSTLKDAAKISSGELITSGVLSK